MLLTADAQLAANTAGSFGNRRRRVASPHASGAGKDALLFNRLVDAEDGRQRFIQNLHAGCAFHRGLQRLAQHPRHRLPMVENFIREERLIMPIGTGVALARHVAPGQRRDYSGVLERGAYVQLNHLGVGVRRHHRPRMQRGRKSAY